MNQIIGVIDEIAFQTTSANQVNEGVGPDGESGDSLRVITTQVTHVHAIVTEVAASAQEQATGLDQVNTAVNQRDEAAQQNAARSSNRLQPQEL